MKETIKASIGGYAFIFDINAYQILNQYLENLKKYFNNKEDGEEIIGDIENRMSELLQMKSETVNLSDAQHIIEIMGNPTDFMDNDSTGKTDLETIINKKEDTHIQKKLYRDPDHAILGGVCSGLGQYFRIDPVIIRTLYVLSIILSYNTVHKLSGFLLIAYFILWIVTPKAKTITQKLSMSGQDPSIKAIENGDVKLKKIRGNHISQILGKVFKVVLITFFILVGLLIIISLITSLFISSIMDLPSLKDFLEINNLYNYDIVTSLLLISLIPAFIVIYTAIRLITKFQVKDILIIGVGCIIWFAACINIALKGIKYSENFKEEITEIEKFRPAIDNDTIRIKLDENYKLGKEIFRMDHLYSIDHTNKSWFITPTIKIKKDSIYKDIEIEISKTAFAKTEDDAKEKARIANIGIKENGIDFIISPHIYNKENLWDWEIFELTIYCPINKTVVIEKPLVNKSTKKANNKISISIKTHFFYSLTDLKESKRVTKNIYALSYI